MTTRVTGSVLANTAVTVGTYGGAQAHAVFTVDKQGRLTSAANVTSGVITAGSFGDSVNIPAFSVNALGQVTTVTNTAIRTSTTGQTGIVQLTDSTSSTSTTTAAVPNSVTTTFNHAQSAFNKANTAASTSVAGIVQLTDSTSSTSTTTAATPNALNTLRTTLATSGQNGIMSSTFAAKLDGIAAGATNVTNTNQLTNGAAFITASATTTGLHTGAVRRVSSVIGSNTSAVAGSTYVLTASLTLTLPSSPTAGDTVSVVNASGTTTPVVARNGQNIMSLAEDMTINSINISFTLTYADATRGWVISL